MTRARSIALVLLLAGAPVALAQADETAPHPQAQLAQAELVAQSEPALVMRELLVLQTDRYDNIANNPKLIQTTLFSPIPHKSRAKRVDANGDPLDDIIYTNDPVAPDGETQNQRIVSPFTEQFLGDTPKPRVAVGIGVNWNSPFGPLRIDLSKALLKEEGDDPRTFSFNVGTQF